VRLKTRPMRQFAVRRAFLERMKRIFDERGIEIPFPHQTIWFGEDKKGAAPPMRLLKASQPAPETSRAIESDLSKDHPEAEIQNQSEFTASKEVVRNAEESKVDPDENNRADNAIQR
ncbi:MAG: mechanosensitive ion channel family protein, partial [Desulfotignum sp.]